MSFVQIRAAPIAIVTALAPFPTLVDTTRSTERNDLLEILEDRFGARSTIIASQLPTANWHDHLADPTLADAILDRVVHYAHRIVLKGPSQRKEDQTEE